MKTPTFEEFFIAFIRQPQFASKIIIGGVLALIPVVNLFAFGYLYRYALMTRNNTRLALPAWTDWAVLFQAGLRFAIVWVLYWLAPVLIAFLMFLVLSSIGLGIFAYILFSVTFLAAPLFLAAALYRYQARQNLKDLLDLPSILRLIALGLPKMVVPSLLFLAMNVVALPLASFVHFCGFLALLAYCSLFYRVQELQAEAL